MKNYLLSSILLSQCFSVYGTHNADKDTKSCDISLEQHLTNNGLTITEGYMSAAQQKQFNQQLASYKNIISIAEIGLNAGHSAENFFQNCSTLNAFVSFDINRHSYTKFAAAYLQNKYNNRFNFVPGDSKLKVREFARLFPQQKFDLIYIDGDHSYEGCKADIENCKLLAHKNTFLWIDDWGYKNVRAAIKNCQKRNLIQIIKIHESENRSWVEARYLLS